MSRTVLILSYFANYDGMACSHHIDVRLSALKSCNATPILLTSMCANRHPAIEHYRVPSCSFSGLRFEIRQRWQKRIQRSPYWKILRDFLTLPLIPFYALEKMLSRQDPTWYWYPLGVLMGMWICRRRPVDTLYSTGGPPVVHAVARTLSRLFAIRWLAEVQDPLIHGYCARHQEELRKLQEVEQSMYRDATRVIFLTQAAMAETEKRVEMTGKGVVVYPGAEPVPGRPLQSRDNCWRLAHFGSLGGVRNMQSLLAAMEEAVKSCPELGENMRVDLYGNIGKDDLQRLHASPLKSLFSFKGCVDHATALAAMATYDLLLLIQGVHEISRETIPSKCYEYFLSGAPVLGLVHDNEELEAMFHELGHRCAPAGQPMHIAEILLSCYQQRNQRREHPGLPSPYTVDRAVRQLIAL
jgi:hypothetical protein